MPECKFCPPHTHKQEHNFLFETEYWLIFLNEEQPYLGRMIIVCKRHAKSQNNLTIEEWIDFKKVIDRIEIELDKSLKAQPFNWTGFLNEFYLDKNPNPHVHWHVRPRYQKSITLFGQTFTDPDFGRHYDRNRREIPNPEILKQLIKYFRELLTTSK